MKRHINIIGAGIAGLSAGCYLQMNGYETQIFELHHLPGGLCTAWKRKDYTFDGCLHWLVGSSPRDKFYQLWNELIDMEKLKFVDHEYYIKVEDKTGKSMTVFCDVDRMETEMLEKAPEDRVVIEEFVTGVRKLMNFRLPIEKAPEIYNLLDFIKMMVSMLPYMGEMKKWVGISATEFAGRCRNELLRKTFLYMFWPTMNVLFLVLTLVWMNKKSAGYPIGGSLNFAKLIEKKYLALGGKINYKSRVMRVIVENGTAKGLVLQNRQTYPADIVISAADGHDTIFNMLDGKYLNGKIESYYQDYEVFPSYIQVSLGIAKALEDLPHMVVFPLQTPLYIDDTITYDDINIRVFNFDPTMAPEGKTVVTSMLSTANYKHWRHLKKQQPEIYKAEKKRIADAIVEALDKKYGGIKDHVEAVDVSTPSTVIRYTNNWQGSFEGWVWTPKIGFSKMKKELPGLNNFYMIGQWVEPGGGVPPALMSGRGVAQIICKRDHKRFKVLSAV